MDSLKPLFVDLDGTLIEKDLSHEAFYYYFKTKPLHCLYHLFIFLFLGRPYLKKKISKDYKVDLSKLKKNHNCIDFINEAKKINRKVYLISGSHQLLVNQIGKQLKLFNDVFGTHKNHNMIAKNKILFIKNNLNILDFDYIGNSDQDLPIWKYSKKVIYTNASPVLIQKINELNLEVIEIKEKFL